MSQKTKTQTLIISIISTALLLVSSTQSNSAENSQSSVDSSQKQAFDDLQKLDSRKTILDLLPLYAHDVRQPLGKEEKAKNLARDLAWIGRALLYDENEIAAVSVLAMAHRLAPDDVSITAALIDNCSRAGYPERAQALLNECKNKDDLQIVKVQTLIAMRETAPVSALKLLEKYEATGQTSKLAASDASFAVIKARCSLRNGLQKTASNDYKKAAKLNSDSYVSLLWQAAGVSLEQNPEDHDQTEQKRIEQIKIIEQASRINANDPGWHNDLAAAYIHHDDDLASKETDQALRCKRFSTRAYTAKSFESMHAQKWELAEEYLQHVIDMRPRSADARFALTRPLRRQKKLNEAIATIRKGLEFNPKAGGARIDLINILFEQKKDDEALREIQTVTKLCPELAAGWRKLGDFNRKQKKWEEGNAAYQQALSLYTKHYEELNVLARNEIAQIHANIGTMDYLQGDKAKALKEATAFNAGKFVVHLSNGLELLHLRPDKIILSELKKERDMQEHILLADMLFETKNYAESLTEYRDAEKINDDDADLHTYVLNVCSESGQWQEAIHEDLALSNVLVKSAPARLGEFFKNQKSK